jgi:hypothetical protein
MSTLSTSLDHATSAAPEIDSELLHRLDTDDPDLNTRHPFIAFKETNRTSGAWRVRIQSRHAATAVLYPNAIRLQARAVSEQGKSSFTWSHQLVADAGNSERLKFRVHVDHGEPAAIEVFPRPVAPKGSVIPAPVKFTWPTA